MPDLTCVKNLSVRIWFKSIVVHHKRFDLLMLRFKWLLLHHVTKFSVSMTRSQQTKCEAKSMFMWDKVGRLKSEVILPLDSILPFVLLLWVIQFHLLIYFWAKNKNSFPPTSPSYKNFPSLWSNSAAFYIDIVISEHLPPYVLIPFSFYYCTSKESRWGW